MSKLDRSLDAFRNAPPDQDALTVGAAAFFDVDYGEVTSEQRSAWRWMTLHMRSDEHVPVVEHEAAHTLRDRFITQWPALGWLFGG